MALFDSTNYQIIRKNHNWYTLLQLKRNELFYLYYNKGQLKYLLLPSVHRPDIPYIECYELSSDGTLTSIFFITISDASRYNEEIFKMKNIYHALFQRNLVEAFSAIGIPTMDIINDKERITLEKIDGFPDRLEEIPTLNEMIQFLGLFLE